MKIIGIYNIKGGVGKTAAAVNLSYLAAAGQHKTLICDLDPQSSTTFYFRVKAKLKKGAKAIIKGDKHILKNIKATDFENLDLLPADFSMRNLDLTLDHTKKSKKKLSRNLNPLKKEYDIIFLDCPPNITLVSENVFNAADLILVPVIPTTLSGRTFEKLLKFFENKDINHGKIVPFFSMVEIRKRMHNEMMVKLSHDYSAFLKTFIPYSSVVEKMGLYRRPVVDFSKKSKASLAFVKLWQEITKHNKI